MIFHIEGKKIPIDVKLVEAYISITHESSDAMQLILTVMLRNILNVDRPENITNRFSEVEIKNILETQLKKELLCL